MIDYSTLMQILAGLGSRGGSEGGSFIDSLVRGWNGNGGAPGGNPGGLNYLGGSASFDENTGTYRPMPGTPGGAAGGREPGWVPNIPGGGQQPGYPQPGPNPLVDIGYLANYPSLGQGQRPPAAEAGGYNPVQPGYSLEGNRPVGGYGGLGLDGTVGLPYFNGDGSSGANPMPRGGYGYGYSGAGGGIGGQPGGGVSPGSGAGAKQQLGTRAIAPYRPISSAPQKLGTRAIGARPSGSGTGIVGAGIGGGGVSGAGGNGGIVGAGTGTKPAMKSPAAEFGGAYRTVY